MKKILPLLLLLIAGCTQIEKALGIKSNNSDYMDDRANTIVLIGAGQSNGTQPLNGAAPVYSVTGVVSLIYEHEGIVPEFTVPTQQRPFNHSVAWIKLGDMLAMHTSKNVKIVNVSFGNCSTRKWQQNIPQLVEAVRKYNPDGILWIQGESDYFDNIPHPEPYQNMRNIIDATRDVNPMIKWWICLDGMIPAPHSREDSPVRIAQRKLIEERRVYQSFDVDKMRWESPMLFGSTIQAQMGEFVLEEGHTAHARAWFDVLSNYFR